MENKNLDSIYNLITACQSIAVLLGGPVLFYCVRLYCPNILVLACMMSCLEKQNFFPA